MKKIFPAVLLAIILIAPSATMAEETTPLPTATEEAGSLPASGLPIDMESLGEIEFGPDGQATLSPDIADKLNQALTERNKPANPWDPYIRIGIDIAIGIGAGLIAFSLFWVVKNKKAQNVKS